MPLGRYFHELGDVVDEIENDGVTLDNVRPQNEELCTDEGLSVELDVTIDVLEEACAVEGASVSFQGAEIEGTVPGVTLEVTIPADNSAEAKDREAIVEETSDTTADGASKPSERTQKTDGGRDIEAASDEVPYYEDRERLQAVYDACDTFAEMVEALDVDVTQATVRQHMVKHGIHPPSPTEAEKLGLDPGQKEATEEESESPEEGCLETNEFENPQMNEEDNAAEFDPLIADGIGLPEDLTLKEVKEVVQESHTFYDVHTKLGISRDVARDLLTELNLLDLVTSRLATKHEHAVSIEEIDERIHSAV